MDKSKIRQPVITKEGCFLFWQQNNKSIEIWSPEVFDQKLSYLLQNPVASGFVGQPENWLFSSARNYAKMSAPIEIVFG
jgi:putative transposase